ncbi:hypothetical protein ACHAWF_005880 [Thalassiosira exigua]
MTGSLLHHHHQMRNQVAFSSSAESADGGNDGSDIKLGAEWLLYGPFNDRSLGDRRRPHLVDERTPITATEAVDGDNGNGYVNPSRKTMATATINESTSRIVGERSPIAPAEDTTGGGKSIRCVSVSPDDNVSYEPPSVLSCPPLLQLQMYGLCCPFIETEEEHDARIGASHLQNYPITWYRKKLLEDVAKDVKDLGDVVEDGVAPMGSGCNVRELMQGLGQLLRCGDKKDEILTEFVAVPAIMSIVDTNNHGPVIEIRALEVHDQSDAKARNAVNDHVTGGRPWWEDPALKEKAPSKVIPLYMVDKVSTAWSINNETTAGDVRLYATPTSKGFLSWPGPELLRFDTVGGGTMGGIAMERQDPNTRIDNVIITLTSLVDWNRRRIFQDIKHGKAGIVLNANSQGSSDYVEIR